MTYQDNYYREIESMGTGLVLFSIRNTYRTIGLKYELLYRDGRKPPLEIAFRPCDGSIERITYFLMDEKIQPLSTVPNIVIKQGADIRIENRYVNEKRYMLNRRGKFKFGIIDNQILVLREHMIDTVVYAYMLNENNGLLYQCHDFVGMIYKNISIEEMLELNKSECLAEQSPE